MSYFISDKRYAALQALVRASTDADDIDLHYAAYVIDKMLRIDIPVHNEKHRDHFYRMTSEDWRNLRTRMNDSDVYNPTALREELDREFEPPYFSIKDAIDAEQVSLLVDRDDTNFITCIVDDSLDIVARIWMENGQIFIENQLKDSEITKGYHYDEIAL